MDLEEGKNRSRKEEKDEVKEKEKEEEEKRRKTKKRRTEGIVEKKCKMGQINRKKREKGKWQ